MWHPPVVKLLLIVNASASSVTARGQVVIRKALSADHDVDMVETSRRGHATRLALGAAARGTDVVVVLGGDGKAMVPPDGDSRARRVTISLREHRSRGRHVPFTPCGLALGADDLETRGTPQLL